ncbi:MAG: hypothetical protein AB7S38_40660 [Vulcanimicrobiota bacterium]
MTRRIHPIVALLAVLVLASRLGFWLNRHPEPDLSISGVKPGMTEPEVEALLGERVSEEQLPDDARLCAFQDNTGGLLGVYFDQRGLVTGAFGRLCVDGQTVKATGEDLRLIARQLEPRLGPPDGQRGGSELFAIRYTRYRLLLAQNTVDWSACLGCDDDGYEYEPFQW